MERIHYNVDGLANENMKTQVKNALEKIQGVDKVCVDLARGSVEVVYNAPATEEEIKSCIENTGHDAR
ncbi:heavy-metal-associated domain-containing protein [Clostridium beijerinckii]|uniref:Copper chaperone CopZ n=2 Tax=Clostridium TaxID=1485 RepID=A0A1S8SX73_CLOBE|nr:heavy metal-associated domain-containing protein [Clostridium beijerinckii]MBA8935073.1 copper chaperone CopZ [Clostridium beijerinckii]MDG5854637.1 heavy metal-associated domain-containing protein [Clostridium beijerinckii]NMF05792.1 heavy-metal-associated domain-containing protein [Clostridium beijerinckii]NOW03877.1 copper chaperone CopZ [Clostridium beijerinckii]NRT34813.1 copper chaperone CopZ [Clostridium beijerinckii]